MQVGDRILAIDDIPVYTFDDFDEATGAVETFMLTLRENSPYEAESVDVHVTIKSARGLPQVQPEVHAWVDITATEHVKLVGMSLSPPPGPPRAASGAL